MASKSAQQEKEPEKAEVIEEALDILDQTLDRVKVLYEQFFLGMQKQPPSFLHTDVERKMRDLAQLQIRNTALRYRFATIQQKFGAYNTYWRRTLRQIENGTYLRNLTKIGRDAIKTGAEIPEEILAAMPKRMREQVKRDREQAIAARRRRAGGDTDGDELLTFGADEAAAPQQPRRAGKQVHQLDDSEDVDLSDLLAEMYEPDEATGVRGIPQPPASAAELAAEAEIAAIAAARQSQSMPAFRRSEPTPPSQAPIRPSQPMRSEPTPPSQAPIRPSQPMQREPTPQAPLRTPPAGVPVRQSQPGMPAEPTPPSQAPLRTPPAGVPVRMPAEPTPPSQAPVRPSQPALRPSQPGMAAMRPGQPTPPAGVPERRTGPMLVERRSAPMLAQDDAGPTTMRDDGAAWPAEPPHPPQRRTAPMGATVPRGPVDRNPVDRGPDTLEAGPETMTPPQRASGPIPARTPVPPGTNPGVPMPARPAGRAATPVPGVPTVPMPARSTPRPATPPAEAQPQATAPDAAATGSAPGQRPIVVPPIAVPSSLKAASQRTAPNPVLPGSSAKQQPAPAELTGPFPQIPKPPTRPTPQPSAPSPAPVAHVAQAADDDPEIVVPEASSSGRSPSIDRRPARLAKRDSSPALQRPKTPPGMSDADVNALYAKYVKAKEMVGQNAGPGAYGRLLETINSQAPKIMEQYKSKGVDFQVVVRDNQVIIKAKPKP